MHLRNRDHVIAQPFFEEVPGPKIVSLATPGAISSTQSLWHTTVTTDRLCCARTLSMPFSRGQTVEHTSHISVLRVQGGFAVPPEVLTLALVSRVSTVSRRALYVPSTNLYRM